MRFLDKYRLLKVNRMTNESFLKTVRHGSMNDFVNIVEWFASKRGCSSIMLSALCYYSYVWGLVFCKREIAPFEFVKDEVGPIDKRIVNIFGYDERILGWEEKPELDTELERLLSLIWEKYSKYDAHYLMDRAKAHYPYVEAKEKLNAKDMYLFYTWAGLS